MEICTVGGFEEVGKNMTAVKVGEDVFIFDAGYYLPAVIELQEEEEYQAYSEKKLRRVGAIPDDLKLDKLGWTKNVRAIIIGHAHLDHVGAVPYLAHRYPQAKILGSPFTIEVLNSLLEDEKITIRNKKIKVEKNKSYDIKGKSGNYKIEFINATHSTIQTSFIALHSEKELFFYALDFKLDNYPTLGDPPNYKRLKEIAKKGIDAMVVSALYSGKEGRTPSERIARNLLEDAFSYVHDKNSALFVTTFSSHIARLQSIVDFGKKTGREIVFLGRSMNKYVNAAIRVNQCPFRNKIKLLKYRKQINSFLGKVDKNRGKYLVVCTGHQAEPGSILDRIVNDKTPFKFKKGDNVIFSSSVIPAPINISSREIMDKKLKKKGVRLQTDIHVSGHAAQEDLVDFVNLLRPKQIIPAHGSHEQEIPLIEISKEFGYKFGETAHLVSNGDVLKV